MTTRNNVSEREDQRPILKDLFQKALVNDSEQLFNLQKIFLASHQKTSVVVRVFVGRIIDTGSGMSPPSFYCDPYFCTYTQTFVLLPSDGTANLGTFLGSDVIVNALITVDPSYYMFTTVLNKDSELYRRYSILTILVDQIEIMPYVEEVTDALSVTLSWVSCCETTYKKGYAELKTISIVISYTLE